MSRSKRTIPLIAALMALAAACDFNPASPFGGFDERGSRVSGIFTSSGDSSALKAMGQSEYSSITVYLREDRSISTTVQSNGSFTLSGLPLGTINLVFDREGRVIGQIMLEDVLVNQEIRIVVALLDSNEVVLMEQERDQVGLGDCPRGAGFWCQNQGGKNPNLSADRFLELAGNAAARLSRVPELDSKEKIGLAVCNTGNQLIRQLATLALNIEANLLDEGEVSDILSTAIEAANATSLSRSKSNQIKDELEAINSGEFSEGCDGDDDDGVDGGEEEGNNGTDCDSPDPKNTNKIIICHKRKNTLSISKSAWPAHQAHQDTCGPCTAN